MVDNYIQLSNIENKERSSYFRVSINGLAFDDNI